MSARQVEPVVVLGLGRFGQSVSLALAREGCEVLAIDRDPDLVREVSKRVTMAVEADVTSKEALEQLGVAEYTRAVVAIGDAVESSLVCALVLKENFKIPEIWAKAINAQQAKILRKIGVTEVVYPELEVGRRVAHALLGHRTEYIPTVDGLAYAALPVSRQLTGQRLADARELAEKGIVVMAVSRKGRGMPELAHPDLVLGADDVLVVCGPEDEVSPLLL
ncbi:MAG TPA: TrkA family potassium uptake protein [Candidatus Limnocylindrales bacterium]|nr:TrkA family potassium uptake protein [Candidatus Limnocylindrales bacterium]